ncbi:type II toxin-antitoxin system RelE/ParE family toxin [Rhodocaloribacter litoris]|uniref:type II toxin-antitoxin system RelE/ParE family toxin n=1 Tax=Rhodocaloribacter litoris TaxID=2558931 RepID=UPI00141F5737|nr:type II toxin-antitoxin system RelE/ParE family toxin [Rhodocaloribacter litoris]QXD16943.1 type II toxin-antitoxin system RelE/ParE family toxin [Rhodocaloribacter litoris]
MALVRWSWAARQDLAAIRDYYESSSPGYARTVISKLFGAVTNLELFPRIGREVPEIENDAFREVIVEDYRIVYLVTGQEEETEVEVLAIAHSRQDLVKKLSRRS